MTRVGPARGHPPRALGIEGRLRGPRDMILTGPLPGRNRRWPPLMVARAPLPSPSAPGRCHRRRRCPEQPRLTTQPALRTVIELLNDFGGLLVDAYGPMI